MSRYLAYPLYQKGMALGPLQSPTSSPGTPPETFSFQGYAIPPVPFPCQARVIKPRIAGGSFA